MTDFDKIVRNKNTARSAFRRLSVEQIEKLEETLSTVKDEKLAQEKAMVAKTKALYHKKKAFLAQLAELGVKPEDLVGSSSRKKKV